MPHLDIISIPVLLAGLLSMFIWTFFGPAAPEGRGQTLLLWILPLIGPLFLCIPFLIVRCFWMPLQRETVSQKFVTIPCRLMLTLGFGNATWYAVQGLFSALDDYSKVHQEGKQDTLGDWIGTGCVAVMAILFGLLCLASVWGMNLEFSQEKPPGDSELELEEGLLDKSV